ncbi:archease [Candidatus Roizmanbacteria bacterium]|nr:archease [Candidatus Roizmanbacteria bacterium]
MKKWVIREKEIIADVQAEVFGKSREALFNNLVGAFSSIITDPERIQAKEKITFSLSAQDFQELVFSFVEKLIYLKDVRTILFKNGKFMLKEGKKPTLKATLYGEKITQRLPIKIDIKALTWHKFKVEKNDVWKATLVFDI